MRIDQMDIEQALIWEGYDPKKVREALRKSAGAFRDLDTVALLQDIYEARGQRSREKPAS